MKKRVMENEKLILSKISMVEYYNSQIVPLSKIFQPMSENNRTAICPFHKDTDPSLHAWGSKGIFHCFGCNYGGNLIITHQKLMSQYHKRRMDIKQTITDLAQIFGVHLLPNGFDEEFSNIFEEAIYQFSNKQSIELTNKQESINNFERQNDSILRDKHMTLGQKIRDYAELDLVYSVIASNQ